MYAFVKNLQKADRLLRYTIQTTDTGWEVREEQNSEVIRRERYQDWHRVERARRALDVQLTTLRDEGWTEV